MRDIEGLGVFYLGRVFDAARGAATAEPYLLDARDLTTHAVCVGMTGSGKTGLGVALLEEAALDGIPAIAIDPKGDLGDLALSFPGLRPADFEPWMEADDARRAGQSVAERAAEIAARWQKGLADSGQDAARVGRFRDAAEVAIYTPGSRAGLPLSPLRSFAPPPPALAGDEDALRERAQGAVSGLLALLGRDADPLQSREHILLSRLVGAAWERGEGLDLAGLIRGLEQPPFDRVGALELESFYPAKDRFELAGALNNLLASPAFAAWLEGEPLDVARLLYTAQGRPRLAVLSIAHLSDTERMFFVTLLLSELVAWMRAQSGTQSLRALLYMDEVFGYLPPTANPASKIPLLTLLKQARAFGLGVVLATQNPVDLDYKALGNAGTWFLGRLQTERDRARVVDGLTGADVGVGPDRAAFEKLLGGLEQRVFLARSAAVDEPVLFQTRFTLSYLRGPLTRDDLRRLRAGAPAAEAPRSDAAASSASAAPAAAALAAPKSAAAGDSVRPLLPPEIQQVFLAGAGAAETYRPALYAEAQAHYVSSPDGVDVWQQVRLLIPFVAGEGRPDFDAARPLEPSETLASAPAAGARFESLAPDAARPARYAAWSRDLKAHFQRARPLELLRAAAAKLVSKPGESEGDFRVRLRDALREERDRAVEALRAQYAKRIEEARARAASARDRLDREGGQLRQQTLQTVVSIGAGVLGALLGGRRRGLGSATTAARSAGRAWQEHDDVGRAEDDVHTRDEALSALEQELQRALDDVRARYGEDTVALEHVTVAPRKGDLQVERLALAWEPA